MNNLHQAQRFLPALGLAFSLCALSACSSTKGVEKLDDDSTHWVAIGSADGAAAGEVAAWDWWNDTVELHDGAFAALIARPNPLVQPLEAHFTERAILYLNGSEAVVEEEVWLLEGARLAPFGTKGFAESLVMRAVDEYEPRAPLLGENPPRAYRDAYARGWAEAYSRALQEREEALDRWLERRYAVYRADVLIARGEVKAPTVKRERIAPEASEHRRAARREEWTLEDGRFAVRGGKGK